MKILLASAAILVSIATASAQSGFFLGGAADGAARSRELSIQERAIELDARDGGSRYERLRQQQQLDAIERQIRRNTEAIEELESRRRIRGW